MMRPLVLFAAIALSVAPASAQDARLVSRLYSADEVVRIEGRAGVQATIAFADDEHIENVAIGDSNSWQVTPNKRANLLFIKPLASRARTNLTVVTDRNRYVFDLVAAPAANAIYMLQFTYPEELKRSTSSDTSATLTEEEATATLVKPLPAPIDPATLNFGWLAKGNKRLLPERIYDDGTFTYLTWSAGVRIPAFLELNEKGEEGPVNFSVRGHVIVIDGVPKHIALRLGKDYATLSNLWPARQSEPPAQREALASNQPSSIRSEGE